ncbi:MAG: hypothetical protein QOH71_76 [Blastocatellia bacterium]|jgi:hypothetical protein|nr:hypothetical protein [Blastocatellia bacterium]
MRLVNCEYEHPEGRTTAWGARVHFLELIEDLVPQAVDDLAGEPLERFHESGIGQLELTTKDILTRRVHRNIGTFWRSIQTTRCTCDYYPTDENSSILREEFLHATCQAGTRKTWEDLRSAGIVDEIDFMFESKYEHYPPCPQVVELRGALDRWAARYNLNASVGKSWCLKAAFYTLDEWERSTENYKQIGFSTFGISDRSPYLKNIQEPPGLQEWDPEYEEREAYIGRVIKTTKVDAPAIRILENPKILRQLLANVRTEAHKYCDAVEGHYRQNGWEKIRNLESILKHLEWTVRFQVRKETLSAIANTANVTVPSVKKEVERILCLIGLEKRPDSRPGRPRGRRDSPSSLVMRQLGRG